MELLTIDTFVPYLAPFANKEMLTPGEASRVLLIITELLIDKKVDLPLLKFLSRFLTQDTYDEIIEEKNIEHQCGYLVCNNSPKQRVRRLSSNSNGTTACSDGGETKFQIYNRKPSIILPNTYSSQYCCKEHYQASLFFKNQLSQEAVFARKDIMLRPPFPNNCSSAWYENGITCLEEVLAKHEELKHQGKSLLEVVRMMSGLSVEDDDTAKDTSELIRLIEDFEIVEKDSNLVGDVPEEGESALIDDESDDEDNDENDAIFNSRTNTNNTNSGYNVGQLRVTHQGNVEGYAKSNKSFGGYVV